MAKWHRKNRRWIPWVTIPVGACVLVVLILILAGRSARDRTDDIPSLLEAYEPENFTGLHMGADGSVELRLKKNDIYWFVTEYGLLKNIEEDYGLRISSGQDRFGFRINDGEVRLYVLREKAGFIPVSYEIRTSCASVGTVLTLTVREVILDNAVSMPENWWPLELRKSYTYDFAESDLTDDITHVSVDDDYLLIRSTGLANTAGELCMDESVVGQLRYYGMGNQDTYGIYRWLLEQETETVPVGLAMEQIQSSGDALNAMCDLLSACTEDSRETIFAERSPFVQSFIGAPLMGAAVERRSQLDSYFASEHSRYEKLLTSVREMYRAGRLLVTETGWQLAADKTELQLGELSGLSATNADARIVFLEADVEYGSEISTGDMPLLQDIPRADSAVIRDMDREKAYDLGVVLSTEGGVPVLLHFRQDGSFCMSDITNDQYIALLVAKRNPVINIGDYLQ